ncbi:hypothetical protein [Natrinema versiforme]|uniref:Uncharacterized protein n=1 Tax=Natrinema versiforme TaxID=88724 RepID=A0A4V1FXS7_9EURY|nr:hypothetical protein [Natrinema versiforme]QCS41078.1 hypothetical protein FEJ81_01475 [Natrinema versiforme]
MKRRIAPLLGIVMLVLVGTYLAVFGRRALAGPLAGALLAGFTLSAILMIGGGLVDSIAVGGRTVSWNALVGIADIVLAIVVTLSAIQSALISGESSSWIFAVAMLAGGTSIAWFGVQTARDSRRVDLEATPSNRRRVAILLLMALSFGIGLFVVTNV